MSESPPPRRVEDHTPGSYAYAAAEWKHKAEEASKEIARLRQELEEAKRILEAVTLPSDHPLSAELRERWSRQFGDRTAEEVVVDQGKSLAEVKAWMIDKRITDLLAENEKLRGKQ